MEVRTLLSGDVNIALNTSESGYPTPLESDQGWGGGSYPWQIVDGQETYTDTWAHGLAFTGGHTDGWNSGGWIQPAGPRQTTIDFGKPMMFDEVVLWHHGHDHIPAQSSLQYWDGSSWIDIAAARTGSSLRGGWSRVHIRHLHIYLRYWKQGTVLVRQLWCQHRRGPITHGWLYEFEVFGHDAGPDLAATSLTWDTAQGGVDYGYTVSNGDLPNGATGALFWSTDPMFNTGQHSLITGSVFSTATTAQTTSYTGHVDAGIIGTPPDSSYKYLLFALNYDDAVTESDGPFNQDPNNVQYITLSDIQLVSADLLSPSSVTFAYSTVGDAGSFTVGLYSSADGSTYDASSPVATQLISPSGANSSGVGSFTLGQPITADILNPYLIVVVNPDHTSVESDYNNNTQTVNAFCPPGEIHANVVLPEIYYDVPIGKAVLVHLHFAPLHIYFANRTISTSPIVGEAQSNLSALEATVEIGGPNASLLAYSTGQAILNVSRDGKINWYTSGFDVTAVSAFRVPTPVDIGNTGPIGFQTDLSVLGLSASGTSFDTVIRKAEDYIHRQLSDQLFLPFTQFLAIHDPGTTSLLVTDQEGRQTGMRSDGTIVDQIPASAYVPDLTLAIIASPGDTTYTTQLTGITPGGYELVTTFSRGSTVLETRSFDGWIDRGQLISFTTDYDPSNGSIGTVALNPTIPLVQQVQRIGFHDQHTQVAVSFNEPLASSAVQGLTNYRILAAGLDGRFGTHDDQLIAIESAIYDSSTNTVTLTPARRLNLHRRYELIVNGSTPTGVADLAGNLLDGAGNGRPGSNYVVVLRGLGSTSRKCRSTGSSKNNSAASGSRPGT